MVKARDKKNPGMTSSIFGKVKNLKKCGKKNKIIKTTQLTCVF